MLVLTCYFNYRDDPQRNEKWADDPYKIMPLISSVISKRHKIVILHDCLTSVDIPACEWVKTQGNVDYSPYVWRWFAYKEYLNRFETEEVFMVDATDVELLSTPNMEEGKLYSGDEWDKKMENRWLQKNEEPCIKIPDYRTVIEHNSEKNLFNAGLVGGRLQVIKSFLDKFCWYLDKYLKGISNVTDMGVYNYVMLKYFNPVTGINTRFKKYEYDHTKWWKHK